MTGAAQTHGPAAAEAAGCLGKVQYATPAAAMRALGQIRTAKGRGRRLVKYHCDFCHQWHLGGSLK